MFTPKPPRHGRGLPYWDFIHVESGKMFPAWLAGPVIGTEIHYAGGSRGCRSAMTEGKVECGFCKSQMPTRWAGYVPLWDERGIRCVTIVGERYAELAMRIPLHAPVMVLKLKRQGSPICVDGRPGNPPLPTLAEHDYQPQDLRPWLVRLWGDEVLTAYFKKHSTKHPLPVMPRVNRPAADELPGRERAEEVNRKFARAVIEARERNGGLPPTLDQLLPKPSNNGKKGGE